MSRKSKSKNLSSKIFCVFIAVMFFGSMFAGAFFWKMDDGDGRGGISDKIFENQVLERLDIDEETENVLLGNFRIFIETGNDNFAGNIEAFVLSDFAPLAVQDGDLIVVYLIKESGVYENSINVRSASADFEFDSFNETEIKDFLCENMDSQLSSSYDYCILMDF